MSPMLVVLKGGCDLHPVCACSYPGLCCIPSPCFVPQSIFYTQSAVRSPQSAVRSPQSAVRSPQSTVHSRYFILSERQTTDSSNKQQTEKWNRQRLAAHSGRINCYSKLCASNESLLRLENASLLFTYRWLELFASLVRCLLLLLSYVWHLSSSGFSSETAVALLGESYTVKQSKERSFLSK